MRILSSLLLLFFFHQSHLILTELRSMNRNLSLVRIPESTKRKILNTTKPDSIILLLTDFRMQIIDESM